MYDRANTNKSLLCATRLHRLGIWVNVQRGTHFYLLHYLCRYTAVQTLNGTKLSYTPNLIQNVQSTDVMHACVVMYICSWMHEHTVVIIVVFLQEARMFICPLKL